MTPPPQPSMPDVRAPPEPAGPSGPIDPAAEIAKGGRPDGDPQLLGLTPWSGPLTRLGNVLFLAHGYLLPLLFLAALVTTVARRPVRWVLRGRCALIRLAGLYVLVAVAIFAVAYFR